MASSLLVDIVVSTEQWHFMQRFKGNIFLFFIPRLFDVWFSLLRFSIRYSYVMTTRITVWVPSISGMSSWPGGGWENGTTQMMLSWVSIRNIIFFFRGLLCREKISFGHLVYYDFLRSTTPSVSVPPVVTILLDAQLADIDASVSQLGTFRS